MSGISFARYHNAGNYFVALLILAVIAFWEPYFSQVLGKLGNYPQSISRACSESQSAGISDNTQRSARRFCR